MQELDAKTYACNENKKIAVNKYLKWSTFLNKKSGHFSKLFIEKTSFGLQAINIATKTEKGNVGVSISWGSFSIALCQGIQVHVPPKIIESDCI